MVWNATKNVIFHLVEMRRERERQTDLRREEKLLLAQKEETAKRNTTYKS